MSEWRLTPDANRDLTDVYFYGVEKFGRAVALAYIDSLRACFARLALNPRMGRPAATADPNVRRLEHRRHVVFYDIEPAGVLILAIIHERSIRRLDL